MHILLSSAKRNIQELIYNTYKLLTTIESYQITQQEISSNKILHLGFHHALIGIHEKFTLNVYAS